MKRSVVSLVSLMTLTVGGASAAQAATPAWCKAEGANKLNVHGELAAVHKETDPADALYTLVAAFCAPDADATAQARELAATRKRWSKRLNMTDADWADAAAWAVTHHSDRNPSIYPPEKSAWSKYDPIDQWAGITRSAQGDSSQATDPAYAADAFGAELTEAGRLGYITVCIGSELPAEWAMCAEDIARFDMAKLFTELRGDTRRTAKERITVRLEAYQVAAKIPADQAKVKELLAKDSGYAEALHPGRGDAQGLGWPVEERPRASRIDGVHGRRAGDPVAEGGRGVRGGDLANVAERRVGHAGQEVRGHSARARQLVHRAGDGGGRRAAGGVPGWNVALHLREEQQVGGFPDPGAGRGDGAVARVPGATHGYLYRDRDGRD